VEDFPQALEVGADGTVKWTELARAVPHGRLRQGCRRQLGGSSLSGGHAPEAESVVTQGELVVLGGACGTQTVHEGSCSVQERVLKPANVVLEKGPGHSAREVVYAGLEGGADDQEPVLCCEAEGKEGVDEAASPLGMFCQEVGDERGSLT
jgi:hypothetical protein